MKALTYPGIMPHYSGVFTERAEEIRMTEPLEKEPDAAQYREVVPRFRRVVLGLSLAAIAVCAGLALLADKAAAQGVMLGGLASVLGFEIAVRTFRFANTPGDKVKFTPSIWWLIRILAYAAALVKSYNLDTTQYHGLFGAIVGLFIVRVVVMVVGITGVDLKKAFG